MTDVTPEQAQEEQAELTLEQAKKNIDLNNHLTQLTGHPSWKALINENYFKQEAARLVMIKSDPDMTDYMDQIDNGILAIGMFRQYLATVQAIGRQAQNAVDAHKAEASHAEADEDQEFDDLGEAI